MLNQFITILLLLLFQTLIISVISVSSNLINISHLIYPKSNYVVFDPPQPHPNLFLKDVLEAILEKEKWKNLDGVRVTRLDANKLRHGTVRRYDFSIRFGKSEFVFKVFDQFSPWNRVENSTAELELEGLVKDIGSTAELDVVKIDGPFELSVLGDDQMSLMLPLEKSQVGLKRILVPEDVTVEVRGAKQVIMLYKSNRQAVNSSIWRVFDSFAPLSCPALLPVHILGPASVVAYRTQNPSACLDTVFHTRNTIELLPGKCYLRHAQTKRGSPISLLSSKIALLEKVLNSFTGFRTDHGASSSFLNVKVNASPIFRFQLELERDITRNDTYWSTLAEWRTKPTLERSCFEVVARYDGNVLKPLLIKKVRPIIEVDSLSWSNLLSNMSFTKSPSVLLPQESLTLDVKW
ncbi:hypothetical protein Leryth_012933 [Lithospermum erythrorhizon]|nr:hypothetical protein Leryth_012933 [Lithospermum erythrorhizon]